MSDGTKEVVVITGGTGYLGSNIVRALYQAGYTLVVLTCSTITQSPEEGVHYITADLADAESLVSAASLVRAQYGMVAALIHAAAAPLVRKPLLSLLYEEAQMQFAPQTMGAFQFFKIFVPLVRDGGHVLGITTAAIEPGAKYAPSGVYGAAKQALRGMLRTLAAELKERSIMVSAVAPAFMPGGLNSDMPEAVIELITKKSAPEDVTSPEEVAATILAILQGAMSVDGKSVRIPGRALTDL